MVIGIRPPLIVLVATTTLLFIACRASDEPGVATHLGFDVQPYATVAAAQSLGSIPVRMLTARGSTALASADTVRLSLLSMNGAHLLGVFTREAINGVATFPDLSVDSAGTGYRLVAEASGLESAVSLPFNVTIGPPSKLHIDSIDYNQWVGAKMPPISVRVFDAGGNFLPTATPLITVGSPGVLEGTTTRAAVMGTAVFDDLVLLRWGAQQLTFTAPQVDSLVSNYFMVWPGPCTQLDVAHISDGHVGVPLGIIYVSRDDSYGNTCVALPPGGSATYTITFGDNPSGATLSGSTTMANFFCCAAFNAIVVDKPGTGYTLIVQSQGLSGTSNAFNIMP